LLGAVSEDLERDRVLGDALEETLGKRPVVRQTRLPHQRGVGREARDPCVVGKGEYAIEVGAIREDLDVQIREHARRLALAIGKARRRWLPGSRLPQR